MKNKSYETVKYKYGALQSFYWMLYCVGYSYVTLYLTGSGFSAAEIGMITALFGAMAALLQPLVGKLADRGGKYGWKPQMCGMVLLSLMFLSFMTLWRAKLAQGILFGCFLLLISCMMPMINAANFYYENRKIPMQFGIARGCGSLFYAVLSLILGKLTADGDISKVVYAGLMVSAALLFILFIMPYGKNMDNEDAGCAENIKNDIPQKSDGLAKGNDNLSFYSRYKSFVWMLVGFVLFLMFHNITNTYLLQMIEYVDGNSENLGMALAISAVLELPVMFGFVWLRKRFSMTTLLTVCSMAFVAKSICFMLAENVWMIYLTQIFQTFSFALFASSSVFYADEVMDAQDKVQGQSLVTMTMTLGSVLGNLLGGFWFDMFGMKAMLTMSVGLAVAGAAIVFVVTKDKLHFVSEIPQE